MSRATSWRWSLIVNERLLAPAPAPQGLPGNANETRQQLLAAQDALNHLKERQAAFGMNSSLGLLQRIEHQEKIVALHKAYLKGKLSLSEYHRVLRDAARPPAGRDLLAAFQKDLQRLQEVKALKGFDSPPELITQIEDYEDAIQLTQHFLDGTLSRQELDAKLEDLIITRMHAQ
jgi:hypothetical protein